MSEFQVAVAILNYNGRKHLEQFLPSVIQHLPKYAELIVIDNGSTDDSVAFLQQNFPSIRFIHLEKNTGYAGGYQLGLQQLEHPYYVLLNSDVEVIEGWLAPLLSLMDSNPQIAAVQPSILSFNQPHQYEYAGAAGGWIDILGYPFARGRVMDVYETVDGQYEDQAIIFWATGAAMMVRKEAFWKVGGLDPDFFAHMEEIDLCWRFQRAGYQIKVEPQSKVYHLGGGTLAPSPTKTYLNFRNNLWMIWKNSPISVLLWLIPVRFGLDALAAWRFMLKGQIGHFWAIAKAHFIFCYWIMTKQNKYSLPLKSLKNCAGVYNGVLIWQYFVKKKRCFNQIVVREK